jgi:hypothetical protein
METTMSDADLLADVPDTFDVSADADVLGGIDEEAQMEEAEERALEAAEEEAQRAAARERQRAAEAAEEAMLEEDEAAMLGEGDPTKPPRPPKLKSGKRPVIQHTLQAPAHASVPLTEEELARRQQRAAKFGIEAPAARPVAPVAPVVPAQLLTMEEIAKMQARASKFGVEATKDPLALISTLAGPDAFWENRRDVSAFEVPRPEAVHIFGTDRMSTEDLFGYFMAEGLAPPLFVEWVNDSSANVVFSDASAAAAALQQRTVPLLPNAQGVDTTSWRTLPTELAAAGKGLQLLFRLASTSDIKPPKRAISRWYGELDGGDSGGKKGAIADKRHGRQASSAPYAPRGPSNANAAKKMISHHLPKLAREDAPSLAEIIAIRSAPAGPTLAEMASAGAMPVGPTLADMAAGRHVEVAHAGPTLADLARAAPPSVLPSFPEGAQGGDLRSLLKGGRAAKTTTGEGMPE